MAKGLTQILPWAKPFKALAEQICNPCHWAKVLPMSVVAQGCGPAPTRRKLKTLFCNGPSVVNPSKR